MRVIYGIRMFVIDLKIKKSNHVSPQANQDYDHSLMQFPIAPLIFAAG